MICSLLHGAIKSGGQRPGPPSSLFFFFFAHFFICALVGVEAAAITGSEWLASFANGAPPGMPEPDMSLKAALAQGSWRTFLLGERYFDSPLWTMKIELYGSFVAFAIASALIFVRQRGLQFLILLGAAALVSYRNPVYFAFCFGVALAWVRSIKVFELPSRAAVPMMLIAIYLLGYSPNVLGYHSKFDFYAWVPSGDPTYLHSIASGLLIVAVSFSSLRQKLDGTVGSILGRYSFPIYLVHLLAIFSVGTISFVGLEPLLGYTEAVVASAALSIAGTIAVAYQLTMFEGRWITFVNWLATQVRGIIGFRSPRPAPDSVATKTVS